MDPILWQDLWRKYRCCIDLLINIALHQLGHRLRKARRARSVCTSVQISRLDHSKHRQSDRELLALNRIALVQSIGRSVS